MTFLKCLNGERERNNIFSNPLYASETSKNWPRAKRNPKKISKNICEIILNTPNAPDRKVPSCTGTQAPTLNTAHSWSRETELTSHHRAASLSPSTPWGQCHHQHHPGSVGGFQAGGEPQKKPQNPHPWDLIMSLGFGNQAHEKARAKISHFCQIPGKAHCYQ